MLTGCPCEKLIHPDMDPVDIWTCIFTAAKYNLPVVASVNSTVLGKKEEIRENGLADHHAYTMLDAVEVELENGKKVRLVQIRNPYGSRSRREWEGAWSDSSRKWSRQLLNKLKTASKKKDGLFWMQFEDYVKNFYLTTVC